MKVFRIYYYYIQYKSIDLKFIGVYQISKYFKNIYLFRVRCKSRSNGFCVNVYIKRLRNPFITTISIPTGTMHTPLYTIN